MLSVATVIVALLLGLFSQMILWGISAATGPSVIGGWLQLGWGVLVLAAIAVVQVRLSIALPLTYLYEQITVDEAWSLTRGHFWSLFGAFAAIFALLMAAWIAVALVFFGPAVDAMLHSGGNPVAMTDAAMMMLVLAMNLPIISQLIVIALILILTALGFVLVTATLASAARELLGLKEGQLPDLSRRG
jgi:hypothetical protein